MAETIVITAGHYFIPPTTLDFDYLNRVAAQEGHGLVKKGCQLIPTTENNSLKSISCREPCGDSVCLFSRKH